MFREIRRCQFDHLFAFERLYSVAETDDIQAVVDLLIPGKTPGIKGPIVDISGRTDPEILFFGPDEGTAEMMDWAAQHARQRGASWWKSFTTGKSADMLGGIPHDTCRFSLST
jgi:NAD-specific glutamate dehydrogenase